ncbi:GDSL esterase/lipase At5g45670-like [Vicia villosa]|uniref:GDSL esterase/lipase At5g45670-like n=1 Tax=Vicia villosa TaxID=3911 RepID=UPI00273B6A6C|nr:GDSL esterase/lipase At5g45670-like [Vicia villosa]
MTCETKKWLILNLFLLAASYMQRSCAHGESPQVKCIFVFSDSFSDNGNNNNLNTQAKANYKPYGIDFPTGATGRFTNGLTTIDYTGQLLGVKDFIPPFANMGDSDILKGVNYASGSGGIRDESGKQLGDRIPLRQQIKNHKTIVSQIGKELGGVSQAKNYLKKCLYYVNIGSNDYLNNYFMPKIYPTSRIYNPEQYAEVLINQYSLDLKDLYVNGARKFILVGLGLLGCLPNNIAKNGNNGSCVESQNAAALIFSQKLRSLVDKFNAKLPNSRSIFVNSTAGPVQSTPAFTFTKTPCCPTRPDGMCIPGLKPCPNRDDYVFYDGIHPSSAYNKFTALTSYDSSISPDTTHPMDIKQLAQYPIN